MVFFFYLNSSPTYQLVSKSKNKSKEKHYLKEAPLVDPEPTSDISNFNAPANAQNANNGNITSDVTKPSLRALQSTLSTYGKWTHTHTHTVV